MDESLFPSYRSNEGSKRNHRRKEFIRVYIFPRLSTIPKLFKSDRETVRRPFRPAKIRVRRRRVSSFIKRKFVDVARRKSRFDLNSPARALRPPK